MLHENLKALRKQKGLTQEELAIRLNVVRQTVSKWESGRSVPDADILMKIADVLDVSLSDLLGAELPHNEGQQNEIAAQLIRLNEQYAIRNRRSKRHLAGRAGCAGRSAGAYCCWCCCFPGQF